jgi:5,5'-dehydrodivanillate O-demethylase
MNDLEIADTRQSVDFASAGPGTPAGIFLRRFWQPVYVSADLPAGKAKPIHIMGEQFTLYRGETGVAHVVGFRCAHRGTQLSTGWVKADAIRCLYHGWTYDGEGACIQRPAEKPPGEAPNARIAAYPTREHLGLIFAFFGSGEPPSCPPFPAFDEGALIENSCDPFPCNWFQAYENSADEVHIAFVHSQGGSHRQLNREAALPDTWPEDKPFGMVRHSRVGDGPQRTTLYIMPNIMRIIIPPFNGLGDAGGWRDTYIIKVPTDDENHLLYTINSVFVPDASLPAYQAAQAAFQARCAEARPSHEVAQDILDGKLDLSDVLDHPKLVLIEDIVAQRGQGAIADRDHEILGVSDICIVRMRRLIGEELRAIAEGRPGRDWVYEGEKPQRGF